MSESTLLSWPMMFTLPLASNVEPRDVHSMAFHRCLEQRSVARHSVWEEQHRGILVRATSNIGLRQRYGKSEERRAACSGPSIWCIFQLVSVKSSYPNSLETTLYDIHQPRGVLKPKNKKSMHSSCTPNTPSTKVAISRLLRRLMKYRLALDLGSTSLGWVIMRHNKETPASPIAVIKAGARVF